MRLREKLPCFYYNDAASLDMGLLIKEKGSYRGAQRDVTYTSVPGRNGDLIIDNGRWKNINIAYSVALINNTPWSFSELSGMIRKWLLVDQGYKKLWDSYDPGYYRLASFSNEVDLTQELRDVGSANISFNCKPFKYSFTGQEKIALSASGENLHNPEACPSKPYIKINGSGTISLSINSATVHLTGVDGYIELDSEIMNAYKGTTPLNNSMTGSFLELSPGDNEISWTGSVSSIEIIPRWCCL